jgi:predicted enzyme related to lactoylglutathione lyase
MGNGKVCYIEMPAADIKTSASFYQSVFGWNIRTRGDGSVADDGVGEVRGMGTRPPADDESDC